MTRRIRNRAPSEDEKEVGKRLSLIRREYGISRRLLAEYLLVSQDHINRIERGLIALRLGEALLFCRLTQTDPRWLAWGEPHPRLAFGAITAALPHYPEECAFLDAMMRVTQPQQQSDIGFERPPIPIPRGAEFLKIKLLADRGIKQYLSHMPAVRSIWDSLRIRLFDLTEAPGAQAALARYLGVTPPAVSQWLSGDSAPTAENALRLLEWVAANEAKPQQKKRPVRPARRAGLKTRKGKNSNEKSNSDQKKQ